MSNTSKGGHRLTSLIQKADIFHGPIYMNVRGRETISTTLGGLLSLALVLIVIAQGALQAMQMIYHSSPTILQMSEFVDNPSGIGLNNTNNFMFALSTTVDGKFINMSDKSLFSFSGSFNQYYRANGERTKVLSHIEFAPCNQSNFPKPLPEDTYKNYNLTFAYCPVKINFRKDDGSCPFPNLEPDCTTPPYFNISGAYLSALFEFIQFNVTICKPDDKTLPFNVKCDTEEKINNAFEKSQVKWNLYYTNNLLNPLVYETPNKTFFDSMYWDVVRKNFKVADIYIDQQTIMNYDSSYSSSNYDNQTFYNIDPSKNREQGSENNEGAFPVLQWNLRRSSFNLVTIRTYVKIQDVLANIGGFSKSIIFIFAIIAAGYVKFKYQMMLSNELYSFEHADNSNNGYHGVKRHSSIQLQQGLMDHDQLEAQVGTPEDQKVQDFFSSDKKAHRRMKYNEIHYFIAKFLFCCRKQTHDEKLAAKSREYVENDIDIINLVRKLQEVDKLKMVLLTSDQRQLFDSVPRPLVTMEKDYPVEKDASLFTPLDESVEDYIDEAEAEKTDHERVKRYTQLFFSYKKVSKDLDVGRANANRRLMNLIGEDLIQVFKKVEREVGDNPDKRLLQNIFWRYIKNEKKYQ